MEKGKEITIIRKRPDFALGTIVVVGALMLLLDGFWPKAAGIGLILICVFFFFAFKNTPVMTIYENGFDIHRPAAVDFYYWTQVRKWSYQVVGPQSYILFDIDGKAVRMDVLSRYRVVRYIRKYIKKAGK